MNIYDISNITGVSIATVSRVLNNSGKVSEATKKRVLDAIKSTGYRPNFRNAGLKHAHSVGLLCNSLNNPRSAYLINNIIPALQNKGLTPLLLICRDTVTDIKQALDYFSEHKAAAVIADGTGFSNDTIKNIQPAASLLKYPLLMLNAYVEAPNIFCILCDMEKSSSVIIDTYLKSGCKSPVFLFSEMSDFCISMLDGFKHACAVNGLELPSENLHICSGGAAASYNYISELITGRKFFDLIMCSDNALGMGAYKAVSEYDGLQDNVAVIGCGYTSCPDLCPLPISSIYCRDEEIFKHTFNSLNGIISQNPIATKTVFTPIYLQSEYYV